MTARRTESSKTKRPATPSGGGSASQSVIEHVVERIGTGGYAPGQRLVESDLVREVGVSRTSVREAIRWLAAGGFLDLEPHRGATVRKLTRAEAGQVLAILESLTHLAIREVTAQIHDPQVARHIERSLACSRKFKRRALRPLPLTAVRDEHVRFHDALQGITGNRILAETRDRLRIHILRLEWQGLATSAGGLDWTAGHEETLIAIMEGDVERAIEAKRRGLQRIRETILGLSGSAFE